MLSWIRRWFVTANVTGGDVVSPSKLPQSPQFRLLSRLNAGKSMESDSYQIVLTQPNADEQTVFEVWNRVKALKVAVPDGEELDAMFNSRKIPEVWMDACKGKALCIYFAGSVYLDEEGYECIRVLYRAETGWQMGVAWMEDMIGSGAMIALYQIPTP